VSDGVDAAVQEMQTPALHAVIDRLRPEPERHQLPPRHHPVLPPGQRCNRGLDIASM
jgi:hypothetical protein